MFKVNTFEYQGPLEILLDLIRKKRLDITKISLAKVTDEFIEYFQSAELDVLETTKFLEIVTILLRIKRKSLFPNEIDEDDEQETVLLERLFSKQYYSVLADILDEWQINSSGYFTKGEKEYLENLELTSTEEYLQDINLLKLSVAFKYLLNKEEEVSELKIDHHEISINDQIDWLKVNVSKKNMKLSHVFSMMPNNYSAIVTFLALLECIRTGTLSFFKLESNDFMIIPGKNFKGRDQIE
ncbi:MAG: segregation and condensation protein A [Halanaerobiales bacterium]